MLVKKGKKVRFDLREVILWLMGTLFGLYIAGWLVNFGWGKALADVGSVILGIETLLVIVTYALIKNK